MLWTTSWNESVLSQKEWAETRRTRRYISMLITLFLRSGRVRSSTFLPVISSFALPTVTQGILRTRNQPYRTINQLNWSTVLISVSLLFLLLFLEPTDVIQTLASLAPLVFGHPPLQKFVCSGTFRAPSFPLNHRVQLFVLHILSLLGSLLMNVHPSVLCGPHVSTDWT